MKNLKTKTLVDKYLDQHIAQNKSADFVSKFIYRDILPHLPKKAENIDRAAISEMLAAHKDRAGTKNLAFSQSRAMLNWLHDFGYISENPVSGMRGPPPLRPRQRVLSDVEIGRFWRLVSRQGHSYENFYKVALLTGQRRLEVARMHSNDIQDHWWTIPADQTKSGRPNTIFLTKFARKHLVRDRGYLLSTSDQEPVKTFASVQARLNKLFDGPHWTIHDLRRTFYTGMRRLGYTSEVAKRLCNHSISTDPLDAVYNLYDQGPECKAAIKAWSKHVSKLTRQSK